MSLKLTHEEFKERFQAKYPTGYRLGKIRYSTAKEKIDVECTEHGAFFTTPDNLLNKKTAHPCPKCSKNISAAKRKLKTSEFIDRAKEKIGDHFDFSEVTYTGYQKKVKIICPEHGAFEIRAAAVLSKGQGCRQCGLERRLNVRRLNKEELVKRLKKIHPELVFKIGDYKNNRQKIEATCSLHGSFTSSVSNLLEGRSCPECGKRNAASKRRLTTADWIKRARKVHGMRYRYHLVDYKRAKELVTIYCRKHGPFRCTPSNHVSLARGCPVCVGQQSRAGIANKARRISEEEFFRRIKQNKFSKKWDLSQVKFIDTKTKVKIGCPKHGTFEAAPYNLFNGQNCPKCAMESATEKKAMPKAEFIRKSQSQYNPPYDYSLSEYKNMHTHVTVVCPAHGAWKVLPSNHVLGKSGCPTCQKLNRAQLVRETFTHTKEQFVAAAEKIHNDRYDYSEVDYRHSLSKVWITCSDHGKFLQSPQVHLAGKGCPACGKEFRRRNQLLDKSTVIERFQEIHGDRYDYGSLVLNGLHRKVEIICSIHGKFFQAPRVHLQGKGCPQCSLSKGETAISLILNRANIDFQVEFKIPEAEKPDTQLRYDFYLPSNRTLIEFDGEQHFRPVAFGGMSQKSAVEVHRKIRKRDRRKNRLAKLHGYKLLRIRFDQDVEASLTKYKVIPK